MMTWGLIYNDDDDDEPVEKMVMLCIEEEEMMIRSWQEEKELNKCWVGEKIHNNTLHRFLMENIADKPSVRQEQ